MRFFSFIFLGFFLDFFISVRIKKIDSKKYILNNLKHNNLFSRDVSQELLPKNNFNFHQKNDFFIPNKILLNFNLIKLGMKNSRILSEKFKKINSRNIINNVQEKSRQLSPGCPQCGNQVK
jgi:hypothetical protein